MSAVIELLQDLVRIPSVNPQGDPGTPHTGEARIAKYIGDYLMRLGMEVEFQEVEKGRPNVIARLKSKQSRRHILLGPHTDTVSVVGMTIDPFSGELRDGKVWGRGTTDTKGPMASMLDAVRRVFGSEERPEETDIWFMGFMGEESGNDGVTHFVKSGYLLSKGIKMDFALVGEPMDLKVVNRHKGALWFRLRTRGMACHASIPSRGVSAIHKMQNVMDFLNGPLSEAYAKLKDSSFDNTGFNVTTIRGGTKVNIIPDMCEVEVDHRSLPQEVHAEILERIRKEFPDVEVEIIHDQRGLDTPLSDPHVERMVEVLSKHFPGKKLSELVGSCPGVADTAVLSEAGIPSVMFGPGSILQAHVNNEFIEAAGLEKASDILCDYLTGLD